MGIKINKPIIFLGSKKKNIIKLSKYKRDLIKEKIGSAFIHKETELDLLNIGLKVSKAAIRKKNKPNILVFVSQTQDKILPSIAEELAEKIKLKKNSFVFTLSSGCSGFVQALHICSKLLDEEFSSALIVCVEKYSKYIDKNDKKTNILFSDAGSATLINYVKKKNILGTDFGFDGKNSDSLCVTMEKNKNVLKMDGNKVFNFGISNIPDSITRCSKNYKINAYIIHPGSKYMLDSITNKLNITKKKNVYTTFDITGNTVSTSIPLIINKHYNKLRNKKIIMSGFGVGLSWASILIKWH